MVIKHTCVFWSGFGLDRVLCGIGLGDSGTEKLPKNSGANLEM